MQEELHTPFDPFYVEKELVRASQGKRLANYLIDVALFYLLLLAIGILLGIFLPNAIDFVNSNNAGFGLLDRILSLFLYAIYMGFVEAIFKGKSLGKLITGTKAVNEDGSEITGATAFKRGFSRAVPLCVFSALSSPCIPWQDRWTDTLVVDEKLSIINEA